MHKKPLPSITGILLAAGLSTRMGFPKQLLPYCGNTIIGTVVDNMLNSNFSEVVVVVGFCAHEIQFILQEKNIRIINNEDHREGMLNSVQKGVRSFDFNTRRRLMEDSTFNDRCAFSLMLVDQPFITTDMINRVIDAYAETDKGIVLPSYCYRRGHPVIFNHKYADDILALDADSGGVRSLYRLYSNDIHYVPVETDIVLRDIDYPEDYREAVNVVDSPD